MSKKNRDYENNVKFEEKVYTTEELKELETTKENLEVVEDVKPNVVESTIEAVIKNEPVPVVEDVYIPPLMNVSVPKTIISEPVESHVKLDVVEYPNAMYKFSVYGNNGLRIIPDKDDVSPCDKCALSLVEARDAISRGFILKWRHPSYIDSEWYDCVLNRYNMDNFAAFIKEEIATRRLPYIYLG